MCKGGVGTGGEGAAWLVPVPVGAYVYGSGESTVILTKVRGKGFREEGHVSGNGGEGATWLVPVPVRAYVYGSGESTVILTQVRGSGPEEGYEGRKG